MYKYLMIVFIQLSFLIKLLILFIINSKMLVTFQTLYDLKEFIYDLKEFRSVLRVSEI